MSVPTPTPSDDRNSPTGCTNLSGGPHQTLRDAAVVAR